MIVDGLKGDYSEIIEGKNEGSRVDRLCVKKALFFKGRGAGVAHRDRRVLYNVYCI